MMRWFVLPLVLCAVLSGAGTAEAQYFGRNKVYYDQLDFRLLQTEHFDIYYYQEEAAATRQAARMAERWYARYSRLFDHTFTQRQPLILYASHPHFAQTNVTPGAVSEGTGGFTERTKSRIALPFAAGLGETDHVLGHEIAHAFQIDIARRAKQNAFALPGWFIEGMAEYLSLGPQNANTSMWMRDAARHHQLPTLEKLDDPRYFPYRYGHALWSYLGTRFGDQIIPAVLRSKKRGVIARIEEVTKLSADDLTAEWHASVDAADDAPLTGARRIGGDSRVEVSPALSPDGLSVMFLSERDHLSLDLYMATRDGKVVRKVVGTATDQHFDSLQYIHSSGAWDRSGERFAMAALSNGFPVLVIMSPGGGERRREIPLRELGEVYNPSWSPDGSRIVFSALKGGVSDLYVYTLETGELRQLTADVFADLHPAWSPDGQTIAFATDRFTSDVDALRFGSMRIGLLDLQTGLVKPLVEDAANVKQINPQWGPQGHALYFVSDRDGISNVYRMELVTRELRQVTHVAGGVSGITATSPALGVASRTGAIAFSVYNRGRYQIHTLSEFKAIAMATAVKPYAPPRVVVDLADASLSDDQAPSGAQVVAAESVPTVARLIADPRTGLPSDTGFTIAKYDDRLRVESIAEPYVGASTGNAFGGIVQTTFGFTLSDTLRDRNLQTLVRVGTDTDDFAGQIAYSNRRGQWNWGIGAGFQPARFYGARRAMETNGSLVTRDTTSLRYSHQWGGLSARYNIDRARRFELGVGLRRTGFEWQNVSRVTDPAAGKVVSRELSETPAGPAVRLAETRAAFVYDTAVLGPTSPLAGQRLRLSVEPVFGALNFADVRVDARRYMMPLRPVTIAARVQHFGRYGSGANDPRLTPLLVGFEALVRGYDLRTFAAAECGRTATSCSVVDELTGSRMDVFNLELRAPLRGLLTGRLDYGGLPIEAIVYADAGFLSTHGRGTGRDFDRFRSVGAGARANLGGIVLEMTASRPFDRPDAGWGMTMLLRPGW
jgi:Tol biopolymer transport system component